MHLSFEYISTLKQYRGHMINTRILCIKCLKYKGDKIFLERNEGILECPVCHSYLQTNGEVLLEEHEKEWSENARKVLWNIRPAFNQNDVGNPRLYFLYMDCYHTLLVGRYNASIVMMGVLVEAILKEIILLATGEEFKNELGPCLKKISDNGLMTNNEISFLKQFKNHIRNPYQHANDREILEGTKYPVIPFKRKSGSSNDDLLHFLEKVNAGLIKPIYVSASDSPALRPFSKQAYDPHKAVELFNEIHDFLFVCNVRYFNHRRYDEFHHKFPQKDPIPFYYEI